MQVGPVQRVDAPQAAQVERGLNVEHPVASHLELGRQQLHHVVAHVGPDLEPEGPTETAPAQLHLDGHQEVIGLVLLQRQVGIAGDAESVVLADGHAREQRVQVGGDDLLEGNEALTVGHDHEAGQHGRHLDPGDAALTRRGVLHLDHQVEGQVGDVGEGVARVDGQRGEDRVDLATEDVNQVGAVIVIERGPVREADSGVRQGGDDVAQENGVLPLDQVLDPGPDQLELLARAQAIHRPGPHARRHLVLQGGHPHLIELVEQLGEDGQELGPLQERDAVVLGQVEQAGPEIEARLLPVGEPLVAESLNLLVGRC